MVTTVTEKLVADTIAAEVYITSVVVVEDKGFVSVDSAKESEIVISTGERGPPGINEEDIVYAKRIDFTNNGDIIYRGEAIPGSLNSSAVWRIRKITISTDSDTMEEWASGNTLFDKIWDNRLSLSYS